MKRVLKPLLQTAVAAAAPLLWRLRRSSLLILMYHRVLPEGHPDREIEQPGMYVSPETLEMHLSILKRHFSLVHLDDWVEAARRGQPPDGRSCALTFDDGWRDNYEFAFPVLRRAGVPATIYLVSDMVGSRYTFWPNQLARLVSRPLTRDLASRLPTSLRACLESAVAPEQLSRGLGRDDVDRVIVACKARFADAEMLAMLEQVASSSQETRDLVSWDEAREMLRSGLIRFGSHTRRHTRLGTHISRDAMVDEIEGSRAAIAMQIDVAPTTFCYPNGDFCDEAVGVVSKAYRAAVTTMPGWNTPSSSLFKLARVGVHEDVSRTRAAFLSRLAGFG